MTGHCAVGPGNLWGHLGIYQPLYRGHKTKCIGKRETGETLQRSPISVVLLFLPRLSDDRKLMRPLTTQIRYDLSRGILQIHIDSHAQSPKPHALWQPLAPTLLVQIFRTFELPRLSRPCWPRHLACERVSFQLHLNFDCGNHVCYMRYRCTWKFYIALKNRCNAVLSHCMPTVAALKSKVEDFSHRFVEIRQDCRCAGFIKGSSC